MITTKTVSMRSFLELAKQRSLSYRLITNSSGSCFYRTYPFIGEVLKTRVFKSYLSLKRCELQAIINIYK